MNRMRRWWSEARPAADDPDVRALVGGASFVDLAGCFSLNLHLRDAGLVLRVHQSFVSPERIVALQELRRHLAREGLLVAEPRTFAGRPVVRCGDGWAEVEVYVPNRALEASWDTYRWLFRGLGWIHHALAKAEVRVPRPAVSTYAPPGSLRRWVAVTERRVGHDRVALGIVRPTVVAIGLLRQQWVPASALPSQLIHGDGKLGNIVQSSTGETLYLDFGFTAHRPRIHDLAHTLAWMVLRPDGSGTAEAFPWQDVPSLLGEYEDAAQDALTALERRALVPYLAAVPLYEPAVVGYKPDPVADLRHPGVDRFLRIAEWTLRNASSIQL